MKSWDIEIKKILEAEGLMGEGEGIHTLSTGNKGIRHLSSSMKSQKPCSDALKILRKMTLNSDQA